MIPERTLCEVVRDFRYYPLPNTKPWFKGLTNLRGNLVPVYDLSFLIDSNSSDSECSNLIVLEQGEDAVAFLSDNLPKTHEVSRWHKLMHKPGMPSGLTEFINEVYAVKETVWIGFNHKQFFGYLKDMLSV